MGVVSTASTSEALTETVFKHRHETPPVPLAASALAQAEPTTRRTHPTDSHATPSGRIRQALALVEPTATWLAVAIRPTAVPASVLLQPARRGTTKDHAAPVLISCFVRFDAFLHLYNCLWRPHARLTGRSPAERRTLCLRSGPVLTTMTTLHG